MKNITVGLRTKRLTHLVVGEVVGKVTPLFGLHKQLLLPPVQLLQPLFLVELTLVHSRQSQVLRHLQGKRGSLEEGAGSGKERKILAFKAVRQVEVVSATAQQRCFVPYACTPASDRTERIGTNSSY